MASQRARPESPYVVGLMHTLLWDTIAQFPLRLRLRSRPFWGALNGGMIIGEGGEVMSIRMFLARDGRK